MASSLDRYYRTILAALQEDGSLGPAELSHRVNLSASQCSRRLARLREEGYITHTVAILDPEKLNLGISAFVTVRLRAQSREADAAFRERIMALPEVVSCDYTTGDMDFILRIWTRDLERYAAFISDKLMLDDLTQSVTTYIVMKKMKNTTQLPLDYL